MGKHDHDGRTDMSRAALKRRADAWALVRAGREHTRAATYLGGYAVECKLKAIAMEIYDCWTLRQLADRLGVSDQEVFTHGLEALLERLPLRDNFRRSPVWHDFSNHVNRWRASWRYDPHNGTVEAATTFLQAVNRVYAWLDAHQR
jgi:hypothetical protein